MVQFPQGWNMCNQVQHHLAGQLHGKAIPKSFQKLQLDVKLLLLSYSGCYSNKSTQTADLTVNVNICIAHQVSFSYLYSVSLLNVSHDSLHIDSIINKCVFVK